MTEEFKCKRCGERLSKNNYAWRYACHNPFCELLGIYIDTLEDEIKSPQCNKKAGEE